MRYYLARLVVGVIILVLSVKVSTQSDCDSSYFYHDLLFIKGIQIHEKFDNNVFERDHIDTPAEQYGIFHMERDWYNNRTFGQLRTLAVSPVAIYSLPHTSPIYTVNETGNEHNIVDLIQLNKTFIVFAETSGRLMGLDRLTNQVQPWSVKCAYNYSPGSFDELRPMCVHYGTGYKGLKLKKPDSYRIVNNKFYYLFENNGEVVSEYFDVKENRKSPYRSIGEFYNRHLFITKEGYCHRDIQLINQTQLLIDGTNFQPPTGWLFNMESRFRPLMLSNGYLLTIATETATNLTGVLMTHMDEGITRLMLKSPSTRRKITGIGMSNDNIAIATVKYCGPAGTRSEITLIMESAYFTNIQPIAESPVSRMSRIRKTKIKAQKGCLKTDTNYNTFIRSTSYVASFVESWYNRPDGVNGEIIKMESDLHKNKTSSFHNLLVSTRHSIYTLQENSRELATIRPQYKLFSHSSPITYSRYAPADFVLLSDMMQLNESAVMMLESSGCLLKIDRITNQTHLLTANCTRKADYLSGPWSNTPHGANGSRLLPQSNTTIAYLADVRGEPRKMRIHLSDGEMILEESWNGSIYDCVGCSKTLNIQLIHSQNSQSAEILVVDEQVFEPPMEWRFNMEKKYRILNYNDRLIFSFGQNKLSGRHGVLITDMSSNNTEVLFSTTTHSVYITALHINEGARGYSWFNKFSREDQFALYISTSTTWFWFDIEIYKIIFSGLQSVVRQPKTTAKPEAAFTSLQTPTSIIQTTDLPSSSEKKTDLPSSNYTIASSDQSTASPRPANQTSRRADEQTSTAQTTAELVITRIPTSENINITSHNATRSAANSTASYPTIINSRSRSTHSIQSSPQNIVRNTSPIQTMNSETNMSSNSTPRTKGRKDPRSRSTTPSGQFSPTPSTQSSFQTGMSSSTKTNKPMTWSSTESTLHTQQRETTKPTSSHVTIRFTPDFFIPVSSAHRMSCNLPFLSTIIIFLVLVFCS